MPRFNPVELYNLNKTELSEITDDESKDSNQINNYFWAPNKNIAEKLTLILKKNNIKNNIIDVGCGSRDAKFPLATHLLDFTEVNDNKCIYVKLDLDFDKFKYSDKYFEFVYCRHTLEDIQNPINAFNELVRVSKSGYIETPSPLVELTKGIDGDDMPYRGYRHHRYIVWSDCKTNTIYFLPKYPILEYIDIDKKMREKYNYLLNNFSIYWNNYFYWDSKTIPNIVIYRNDINFKIDKDYATLLNEAINSSIEYTNKFITFLKNIN